MKGHDFSRAVRIGKRWVEELQPLDRRSWRRNFQRLKPGQMGRIDGTTKVVPFHRIRLLKSGPFTEFVFRGNISRLMNGPGWSCISVGHKDWEL